MFAYIIKDGEHLFITIISIDIFEPVLSYGPVQMYHKFQKHNLSVKLGSIAAIRKRMLQLRDRKMGYAEHWNVLLQPFENNNSDHNYLSDMCMAVDKENRKDRA